MLHVHGGGFISQVKLVIFTVNWDPCLDNPFNSIPNLKYICIVCVCIYAATLPLDKDSLSFQTSKSHLDYLHQWAIKLNVSKVFPNNKYNLYIMIIQLKPHFHKYIVFISSLSMRTLKVF